MNVHSFLLFLFLFELSETNLHNSIQPCFEILNCGILIGDHGLKFGDRGLKIGNGGLYELTKKSIFLIETMDFISQYLHNILLAARIVRHIGQEE